MTLAFNKEVGATTYNVDLRGTLLESVEYKADGTMAHDEIVYSDGTNGSITLNLTAWNVNGYWDVATPGATPPAANVTMVDADSLTVTSVGTTSLTWDDGGGTSGNYGWQNDTHNLDVFYPPD
jgi:hypothetical protein